ADALLTGLRAEADLIVVDSPPLLAVTDAAVLATKMDGTVLVVDAGATRVDVARRAVAALTRVGVKPIGAVVNRFDRRDARYYSPTYRYGYE
ncbi:tyrosine-protein kinase family protein, partial [Salmonella sp. SAL4438]|uniref:tyrosine-protein kinase family protein n=1 Tax=Salmonella sp. SAL4438 TaxID=3159893 RepID=UPI00397CB02E